MNLNPQDARIYIAKRIAKEFKPNDIITLGIGIPTRSASFIPEEINVFIQAENGIIGCGKKPDIPNPYISDAGGNPSSVIEGGAFFDTSLSFTIIRGGHIDKTVLGALEVDEQGNLANYMIPGKFTPGIGGAMDLVAGVKEIIIAMEHTTKDGNPKILKNCTLPLTGKKVIDLIITELAVIKVQSDGLHLIEIAPHTTIEEVLNKTEANLKIDL